MIFVTVGTNEQPFDRLVAASRSLASDEPLVVQHGSSSESHGDGDWRDFLTYEEMSEAMESARVVVTHAGVGSIILAHRSGKRPIVMPRRVGLDEAVDDHQVALARRLEQAGYVTVVETVEELVEAVALAGRPTVAPAAGLASSAPLADDLRECLSEWVRPRPVDPPAVTERPLRMRLRAGA